MIHSYMNHDVDPTSFPSECAEISAQMTQIKSEMQHSEQLMKEESARKNDLSLPGS